KYYKNGTEIAAEEVKNAGTYTVKAVVAEGANYEAGTVGEWSFTIAKQPVAKPAADQTQFVYSSAPQTYNPAGFDETLMAVADNVRTDAGSQKVKVSLTDKDNYCWDDGTANETTADLEFDFEIKAKKITAVVTVEDKVYDGNTTASILSATLEGVETDDADAVVLVNGTAEFADKNTGRDKIIIFTDFALNGSRAVNYILKNSQPAGVTADIYAATVTVSGITAKNKIYDGTIAAEFDAANAQLTGCMVADDVRVDTAAATAEFADKNAGTKAVSFAEFALAGTDKDNYILTQPADVQASITPKVISIAWGGTSFTFNGSQQMPEATATGLIAGDSCEITVDGAQRNVGSGYKATAVSLSNADYAIPTDEAMNSILFEVIAQTLTKPAADTTRFVYNGYYQTYKIAENELYTVSGNVQRDSGNHKVTVSLKDKVNCTWTDGTTDDVTLVFTIAPKGLKVMVTVADKIYDGNTNATIAHSYLIGIVDGDDVGLIDGVPTFTSAEVGDNIPVKFTKFSLKHKDAYNYYVYSPKGIVASIKPLTVQTPVVAPTEKPGQEIIEKAEETFPTPTSTPTPIIEENNGEAEDITAEDTPAESKGYMATFPWWIFAVILVAGIVIFIILKRKSDDEE
ncbi:MAG: hypothetical protein IJW74_02295, partial [Oscillospiraceae bacterium]|nr:hypothetical protein [Oscillospiraceae bacterium]